MLLLLSHFSPVQLCATPWTAAHQAPPSLGFSRQEHWSGLPFLSPIVKVKSEKEVAQSCPTLSDPMDYSPPGPAVPGILQARALEWLGKPLSCANSDTGCVLLSQTSGNKENYTEIRCFSCGHCLLFLIYQVTVSGTGVLGFF